MARAPPQANTKEEVLEFPDLEIYPVKAQKEPHPPHLPLHMPAPPFLWFVAGGCGSGKSAAVCNALLRPEMYRGMFSAGVVLISPTAASGDPSMRPLVESRGVKHYSALSDELIELLVAEQEMRIEEAREAKKKDPQLCIIIDDCLGSESFSPHAPLAKLCSVYRHKRCSLIVLSQLFRSVPPVLRANLSGLLIFFISHAEVRKMVEEWGGTFPDLEKMFDYATGKPYSFLYLKTRGGVEARVRFSGELLYTAEDRFTKVVRPWVSKLQAAAEPAEPTAAESAEPTAAKPAEPTAAKPAEPTAAKASQRAFGSRGRGR